MRWKDAKAYNIKPNRKHKRKRATSHKARQRQQYREHKALRSLAICLLLGLKEKTQITERHIEQAETKLRLPVLRLRLNRSDPPYSFRIARVYRALQDRR